MPESSESSSPAYEPVRIGLVSVSDRASAGVYEDKGIPALRDWLGRALRNPIAWETRLIPDEQETISAALRELVDEARCDLVLTTGGTGPAPRDVTPEATLAVATKEMPGFGEQMRRISLSFVPTAILSRQVAVIRGKALVINLPGQPKAIAETLEGMPGGHAAGARHLRRGAVLHRPDRRPLPRDRRGALQGVPAEVGDPAGAPGHLTGRPCPARAARPTPPRRTSAGAAAAAAYRRRLAEEAAALVRPQPRVQAAAARAGRRGRPPRRCGRVEHDQPVHRRDGRQPVRDRDHGLAFHQPVEALLDRRLDLASRARSSPRRAAGSARP